MYAYIDETGNTGKNIFDSNQPVFWIGAMMTYHDFDKEWSNDLKAILNSHKVSELHATKLGINNIEKMAKSLKELIQNAGAKFFFARIIKRDLAAFKFFDTFFDPGENNALSQYQYNLRPLRLLLLSKVSILLDDIMLQNFWEILLSKNNQEIEIQKILEKIIDRSQYIPDERSRQLIHDALTWAIKNPKAIDASSYSKQARQIHMPNMVGFTALMRGIHDQSKAWNSQVEKIKHDRQDQFKTSLIDWHNLFSNFDPISIQLPFEGTMDMQVVPNSKFSVEANSTPGLEVIDTALWIVQRNFCGEKFTGKCERLRKYIMANSSYYDMSMENAEKTFISDVNKFDPITSDRIQPAMMFLKREENQRVSRMHI